MRCLNRCPQNAIEAAHGMVVAFWTIFSVINSQLIILIINILHINSEQWWWKIIADLIGIGGMVLIAAFLYRAMHYAMGYKPGKYLVRFTSLTASPFWRRYKFSNKSRSQAVSREMNKKNRNMNPIKIMLIGAIILASCTSSEHSKRNNKNEKAMAIDSTKQYGFNREFLKKHVKIIELRNAGSAVTIVPAWQGRVMTSTADGDSGFSFGWINRELIASGKILPHINAFGGEERLWLGPEGGQFSIFFSKGKPFIYDNWQTPAFLDTDPFRLISSNDSSALFGNDIETENYSGTFLKLHIEREVTLLSGKEIKKLFSFDPAGLQCVAYRSNNKLTNTGVSAWKKETGLLSIWMLGMFNPSPAVIISIPVKPGDDNVLGPKVNDSYFGKISGDRLKVSGNNIFFKADGKSRGKIGIPPLRATGVMGSFDSDNNILTLLICRLPDGKKDYVNSSWQIQENPFSGDALNSYNDGPLADGTQMGPFYELETSSPAADLKSGESLSHVQYTLHLKGDVKSLDVIARKVLGISLEEIATAF